MCGLSGCWTSAGAHEAELAACAAAMARALAHRGPDDAGAFVDAPAGFALGFRRLAIVDLSPGGHQPMASADGRYVLAFNGEIYNHRDLRDELAARGARFRGHSDTEVALEAIRAWGVEASVPRLWGMFAIAVWDARDRRLWLARDRLGKKPLYYGRAGETWLFGSELKALRAHPRFDAAIDRASVRAVLEYGYVPAPWTIYRGTAKLPPGSLARLEADGRLDVRSFWRLRNVAERGVRERERRSGPRSDEAALDELESLLRDAVGRRLVADVPLGAFLSGGIDSSLVVALMRAQCSAPVRTFTIGFAETAYDESASASAVARHLGTEHIVLPVAAADALAVVPRLPVLYDEPFADASQIPTHLVAALARPHVTVALTGDGGDEVFGGYVRHVWLDDLRRRSGWVPSFVRRGTAGLLSGMSESAWDAAYARLALLLPSSARQRHPGDKVHKLARVLSAEDDAEAYRRLIAQWDDAARVVPDTESRPSWADEQVRDADLPTTTDRTMLRDSVGYLPDDILTKVDRATMGVALEARAPLLDHRVVEWSWTQPIDRKIRAGQGKWLLRRLLHRHVPPALVERPKSGFGIPLEAWLRGPLRDWAEALLAPERLAANGLLEPAPVRAIWARHLAGAREGGRLWPVLMLQAWRECVSVRA